MTDFSQRDATESDIPAIRAIYAHHVEHGLGTFEEAPPTVEEMARRWRATADRGMPYIVAIEGGSVCGYAYADLYRPRVGYRYSVEDSVYVAPDSMGRGHGRRLVGELVQRCTDQGFRQMVAVIGDRDNRGSIGVHKALGFAEVGCLPAVGFKFGRWVDVVIMQRALGPGETSAPG